MRRKQDQVGKLAGRQPWEPAAVLEPPEGQAPVTFEAVPAQFGVLEPFAAHGLHGIAEDRLHLSDFYQHGSCLSIAARGGRRPGDRPAPDDRGGPERPAAAGPALTLFGYTTLYRVRPGPIGDTAGGIRRQARARIRALSRAISSDAIAASDGPTLGPTKMVVQ